jgi:hypothetical protein
MGEPAVANVQPSSMELPIDVRSSLSRELGQICLPRFLVSGVDLRSVAGLNGGKFLAGIMFIWRLSTIDYKPF